MRLSQADEEIQNVPNGRRDDNSVREKEARRIYSKKLREVLQQVDGAVDAESDNLEIRQIACDSRKVQPGALFFALRGAKEDGTAFIQDAIRRGAVAVAGGESLAAFVPENVARFAWFRRAKR